MNSTLDSSASTASREPATLDLARLWLFVLAGLTVVLAIGAVMRVPLETQRLAFEPLGAGASTDLKKRFIEIVAWWRGEQVYGAIESADYPPASYLLMWPFIGWARTLDAARLAWAATTVAMLAWLTTQVVRGSSADRFVERTFMTCVPLALYATAAMIRIGQIGLHILPPVIAATL